MNTPEQETVTVAEHALEAWEADRETEQILGRMEIAGDAAVAAMSAGMKRRTLLARTRVRGGPVSV